MTESTRPTRVEVNCTTGEVQEIELTDAEVAQLEADRIAFEAQKAIEDQAKADAEAAKASAQAKLAALGLTDAEISALSN